MHTTNEAHGSDGYESVPWTDCAPCGRLDHPGMTCDQAEEFMQRACDAAARGDVTTSSANVRFALNNVQLEVILMVFDDPIAYREPDGDFCADCEGQKGLCADHRADQDRAGDYRISPAISSGRRPMVTVVPFRWPV